MRLGRKRGAVYDHYFLSSERGHIKRFKCKHCHKETSQNRKRMEGHLEECPTLLAAAETPAAALPTPARDLPTLQPGRKRGAIYEHFSLSAETLKGKRFKCVHCGKETSQNKMRMEHHLLDECREASVAVKEAFARTASADATEVKVPPRINASEFNDFEDKMVLALVTGNVPWSFVENPFYQAALRHLQPAAPPLTAAYIESTVVPRLEHALDEATRAFVISARFLTIVVDACADEYTNIILVNEDGVAKLLSRASPGTDGALAMANVRSFLSSQAVPPPAIVNVCDGAGWTLERKRLGPMYEVSLSGGCLGLLSMLFLKDLLQTVPSVLVAITSASRFVTSVLQSPTLLAAAQLKSFARAPARVDGPSGSAWVPLGIELKRALRLSQLLVATRDVPERPASEAVATADALLAPFHCLALLTELRGTSSGQCLAAWVWALGTVLLSPSTSETDKRAFADAFTARFEGTSERHWLAALVLDPRVHGAGLSPKGRRVAEAVVLELASTLHPSLDTAAFLSGLASYMDKTGEFADPLHWEPCYVRSPSAFWHRFQDFAELSAVAKLVCGYAPVAASLERHWLRAALPAPPGVAFSSLERLRFAHAPREDVPAALARFQVVVDVHNELPTSLVFSAPTPPVANDGIVTTSSSTTVAAVLAAVPSLQPLPNPTTALSLTYFDLSAAAQDNIRDAIMTFSTT
ncbi:hypothetical protein ACHHYP_03817 [Achlya hypogyna]|uniref:BED-type domain-containing protein n=1 Tax=Achlya hypogyna TaxID=1202772 RepID=A0A1V9Z2T8_ACHHY|nr:hypothetical protein ACHHYP_03817 [Achlya hypogyna]